MIIRSTLYNKLNCKLTGNLLYFQINKRFYPGRGGKKAVDVVTKGTGLNNASQSSPFQTPSNPPKDLSSQVSPELNPTDPAFWKPPEPTDVEKWSQKVVSTPETPPAKVVSPLTKDGIKSKKDLYQQKPNLTTSEQVAVNIQHQVLEKPNTSDSTTPPELKSSESAISSTLSTEVLSGSTPDITTSETPQVQPNPLGFVFTMPKPPIESGLTIGAQVGLEVPLIVTPHDSHPLMLTDGQESGEPQRSTPQRLQQSSVSSDQDNSDVTEHLLATPGGLVPISSSFADDPHAVQLAFNILDKEAMLKRHDPQTVKLIQTLYENGLLDLHGKNGREGLRPNKHFRDIYHKLFPNDINVKDVMFTQLDVQTYLENFSVDFCLLSIEEKHELNTIFLLPEQTHIGLYSVIANQKIYWSFLTSDQDQNNIMIASYQPFGDDVNKTNRPQMLHILTPQSILDKDLMLMPPMTLSEAKIFLSKSEVQEALKKLFIEKVLPHLQNTVALPVYEGIGVTLSQVQAVITEFEREQFALAEKKFKTNYVNKLKLEQHDPKRTDLQDWMRKIEKKTPREYKYVAQLANEYNEKNKIPKRYETLK